MRFYLSLYLLAAGVYLLTASGRIGLSDSVAMLNVAQSVIDEGSFSSEPCEADDLDPTAGISAGCVPGTDGRNYAAWGLLPSLAAVPAVLGARGAAEVLHADASVIAKAAVSIFTLLVAPLVCVVLAGWIVKLGYSRRTAAAGACILAFASPFWHNSVKGFFSEPYFTLALVISAYTLSSPRRRYACAFAGLAFGMACGVRLNGVILFPAFILALALHTRAQKLSIAQFLRDSVQFSVSFGACALLIAWANYARFGSPFKTGYHLAFPSASSLLSTPLLRGLPEILFSGKWGVVVFAPWVLAALILFPRFARKHPAESVLCGTGFLIFLLFFAQFATGPGWFAGPRYLVPVLPFLVLAMVPGIQYLQQPSPLTQRTRLAIGSAVMVLVTGGLLIQVTGTFFPDDRYWYLTRFYQPRDAKPWWSGSIPLASIDFLTRMSTEEIQGPREGDDIVSDQLTSRRQRQDALASKDSATTEEEFLGRFPNPINLLAPNLMVLKLKAMGLPVSVGIAYSVAAVLIGLAGAIGLKQSLAATQTR